MIYFPNGFYLCRIGKDAVEGPPHNLLESVAHSIATATLQEFPQISAVRVKVGKPHVAVQGVLDHLGVEIMRRWKRCFQFFIFKII
jgi:7,8-dihydroneopterin aldolase/epimerase/oxygenase